MKLRLTPAAEADVRDINGWYREQGEGLAPGFRRELDERLSQVRRMPHAYPAVHGEMRRVLLRRYPYAIFYVVGDTEIGVLGIFHGRRDPKVWKSRYDT